MKVDLDKLETSLEGLKNLRVEHSKQCPGVLTVTDITTGEQLDCIEPLLIRRSTEEDEAFTEAVAAACTNIFALIAELRELRADAAQKRVQDCETRMMRYAIQLGEMQSDRDAARAEVERLREDAARARWCEEMKATVSYNGITQKWTVIADEPMPWRRRYFDSLDRNAAIDAARGKV